MTNVKCTLYNEQGMDSFGAASNRPKCFQCDSLSMYFCPKHHEFYCTNCIVDHPKDNSGEQ